MELDVREEGRSAAKAALHEFERLGLGYEAGKAIFFLAIAASQEGSSIQASPVLSQLV